MVDPARACPGKEGEKRGGMEVQAGTLGGSHTFL